MKGFKNSTIPFLVSGNSEETIHKYSEHEKNENRNSLFTLSWLSFSPSAVPAPPSLGRKREGGKNGWLLFLSNSRREKVHTNLL